MELRFFGGFAAEAYRWCDCAALATVLQYMKMLKINVNKLDWRTVVITIENITIQDDDHIIGKTYKNLISSAFNTDRDGFYHGAWIFDLPTLTKAEIEKNVLTIKNIATIYTMLKTFKNLGEISFIKIMFWYINTVQPSSAASLMLYSYAIKYSPYFYGECGKISQSFIRKLSPMLQISKDNRELIAFAQQLINSNDSELKNAGIEFLITLCNGKKISPDFINLCQDAVNDVNFEIRTDGINLLIELSKKTEQDDISSPALEMAIALASKIINSTIDKTRTTGIMLFKAICKQKYVPPGLIDLAEQMVRDNNPKIQNLGTNLFVELSNSNRKDIFNSSSLYEEDIQTVISAMADNNNDDNIQNINSIAYNLLIKTVRYSTDIFSNEDSLINQVENIIHNPNKDGIKLLGFFLLSELLYSASKAPKGFFEKIIKYIMNINPELLNKAYQFVKNKITSLGLRYNWLSITEDLMIFIDKPKKYVIDYLFDWFDNNKIIDYQNNLYDPYNDDCAYTVFSIFTDLCKDGIIFNTSIPIAIKALFSQNDILKDSALDFIKALFKHNKGFNELIANKELKDSQPKIYKTICEEAQKYPAGLQAIEENEQKEPQSSIASQ